MVLRVAGGGPPCRTPTWTERGAEDNAVFLNLSFDFDFALVFEILPFKVGFLVCFFLMPIFQSITVLNRLKLTTEIK